MKQRLILIGAGLVLVIVVARLVIARPGATDEVAVDTTGASAQAGASTHPTASAGSAAQNAATPAAATPVTLSNPPRQPDTIIPVL